MVAPIATQHHALVSAFSEFACLPDLLARLPAGPHYHHRSLGPPFEEDDVDFGPGAWRDFFHEYPPNVDHVQYWQYEDEGRLEPRLAVSVCADAWGLAWRLQLVGTDGLSPDGRALAEIGTARSRSDRTAHDHSTVQQVLAQQVKRYFLGARELPIVPVLQDAARELAEADSPAAVHLPGLLLAEVAFLIEWAHIDAAEAQAGAHRLAAIRNDLVRWLGEPNPRAHPWTYQLDLADSVNGHHLETERSSFDALDPLTLTEVRAMSSLLVFTGLLREVFPLGPVQCLAAVG